jgi:hypothetical protein
MHVEMTSGYNILGRNLEGMRPLTRSKHRYNDDIKSNLKGTEWEGVR